MITLFVGTVAIALSTARGPCGAPPARGGVAFAVVEAAAPNDTLETVTICLVSDTAHLRIAGYHGELTTSRSARVVLVDRPPGGTRIENTGVPGRVSFAGVSPGGIAPGAVLALHLSRRSRGDDAALRLTMIDVTDIDGRDVASQVRVDSLPHPPSARPR